MNSEENLHKDDAPEPVEIHMEQKAAINRGVLGWIVGILVLAVLTWILYETLYKPMFGLYAFLLGAFTGIMLYRKLTIRQ